MSKEKPCGALWLKTKGETQFFSGEIELDGKTIKIVAFPNDYKKEAKHPDFKIFLSRPPQEQPVAPPTDEVPLPEELPVISVDGHE